MAPVIGNSVGESHRTLDALVADELRRWILDGRLAPGARLVETAIAEELRVSRGPVRDAIRQLEREGLVSLSPRRGATVADITVEEGLECYDIRIALEGVAARLAAERRTPQDIASLTALLKRGDDMLSVGRWAPLAQMNYEFHAALATAARNKELISLLNHYATRIAWMFSRSAEQRGGAAWDEHSSLVDAVIDRDADLAEQLARQHIANSRAEFLRHAQAQPAGAPLGS